MLCLHACVSCLCAYCPQKSEEHWMVVSHHVGARNSPQEEQVSTPACTILPTPKYKFCCFICLGGGKDWNQRLMYAKWAHYYSAEFLHTSTLRKFWDLQSSSQYQNFSNDTIIPSTILLYTGRKLLLFNTWCWETWMLTCKSEFTHITCKNSIKLKELRYKILPQRHMNKPYLEFGNEFLNLIPKV